MNTRRWSTPTTSLFALILIMASLATTSVLFTGCGESGHQVVAPPVSNGPQVVNLNDENGGLKPTSESPGFGNSELLDMAREEVEAATIPGNIDPTLFSQTNPPIARIYSMSIIWGTLPGENDGTGIGPQHRDGDLYDWSGGVRLSRGGLSVRGVISFEDRDHLVVPRTDRRVLEWVSHTSTGVDGVRIALLQAPFADSTSSREDTLYFTAGAYHRTFLLSELEHLDETVTADEVGNQIRFQSTMVDPALANHGFARGIWGARAGGDSVGTIGGILVSDYGRIAGYFHGYYGENSEGKQVLFAKVTGTGGEFKGFLRGNWGQGTDQPGPSRKAGWFRATWFDGNEGNESEIGAMTGTWRLPGNERGDIAGRWCLGCNLDGGGAL